MFSQLTTSNKGNPYGNAMMETFYKTIKRALINEATFTFIEQAQLTIFKSIETYDNTQSMHSTLGYRPPKDFLVYRMFLFS